MFDDLCHCGCGSKTPIAKRNRYELGHRKGYPIQFLGGHKMKGVTGEKHPNWHGDNVGYKAFHLRVNQSRGKATICEDCGSISFVEWASLTKNYENIMDYKALCRKCHHKLDQHNRKSWETRRKTSFEASSSASSAEGGVAEA